jgi:drug/metabolite transporter (DMT)-like permease
MSGGPPAPAQPRPHPALLLAGLLMVDGLHFVFARALRDHLPAGTSAMYVMAVGATQLTVYSLATGRLRWSTFRRHAWFFLTIGALVATSTTINYTAVSFIDPGTAALLAETSVVFSLGFGLLWLRERLAPAQWAGAAIAIVGVGVITFQPGDYLRLGSLLVLSSALVYAFHTAIVKRHGQELDFVEFFVWRLLATFGFMFLSVTGRGELAWPDGQTWPILLLAGTVDVVISRSLYYAAVRRLDISILSLILTASPVVAILWSLVLFAVRPTLRDLLGGAAVLAGVAIVTRQRAVQASRNASRVTRNA